MISYAGMRVFVSRPQLVTMRRSWRERLLTWPWRPWQAIESRWTEAALQPDDCYVINGDLHCGERAYEQLKQQTKNNFGSRQ
jgi:hypothetical protein